MKKRLEEEISFSFENTSLIGIVNHSKEYSFAYHLNENLNLDFCRKNDFELYNPKESTSDYYTLYFFEDEELLLNYLLLSTRNNETVLNKNLEAYNYLLFVWGVDHLNIARKLTKNLTKIPGTLLVKYFDFSTLHKKGIPIEDLKKSANKETKILSNISDFLSKVLFSELEYNYLEILKNSEKKEEL